MKVKIAKKIFLVGREKLTEKRRGRQTLAGIF